MKLKFELKKRCGKARLGQMVFERGVVRTPAFMPVGTLGTVKGVDQKMLKSWVRIFF